jgi:hypothetical protein
MSNHNNLLLQLSTQQINGITNGITNNQYHVQKHQLKNNTDIIIITGSNYKSYWHDNNLHNPEGPSITWSNSYKEWHLYGNQFAGSP